MTCKNAGNSSELHGALTICPPELGWSSAWKGRDVSLFLFQLYFCFRTKFDFIPHLRVLFILFFHIFLYCLLVDNGGDMVLIEHILCGLTFLLKLLKMSLPCR